MSEGCFNCQFYRDQNPGGGHCRFNPPVPFAAFALDGSGANHFETLWPWVTQDDWCGKWEREPSAADEIPVTVYAVKPTRDAPCPTCGSKDGGSTERIDIGECQDCGASDIPF